MKVSQGRASEATTRHHIAEGQESGGTHTSRTMMLADLQTLLGTVPADARHEVYKTAVIEDNVLGKGSESSRKRSFRYLRELYLLDPAQILFRALRDLWDKDPQGRPLLAMLSSLARDSSLRATTEGVLPLPRGAPVSSHDLEDVLQQHFDHSYSDSIAFKIGRNAASSWTQSGHLKGRTRKVRSKAEPTPGATAYALLLGYLTDQRGVGLFDTLWADTLDRGTSGLHNLAVAAGQRGWLEYRQAGNVIDVGFRWLLRETETTS